MCDIGRKRKYKLPSSNQSILGICTFRHIRIEIIHKEKRWDTETYDNINLEKFICNSKNLWRKYRNSLDQNKDIFRTVQFFLKIAIYLVNHAGLNSLFPLYLFFCNRFFLLLSIVSLCLNLSPFLLVFFCIHIHVHIYVNWHISLYGCCHVYNLL